MEGLTIQIGWEYFLGIIAALLAVAWFTGRRFSSVETDISWLKDGIKEIKLSMENIGRTPFFQTNSPVDLTQKGNEFLQKSELKIYLEHHKDELMAVCKQSQNISAYDVQQKIFEQFDNLTFETDFEKKLKDLAYLEGISMDVVRRIAAIYFRDICLKEFNLDKKAIDNARNAAAS